MRFAIIGLGYISERHLAAIKSIGGELLFACDNRDSVGILDKYFPDCRFFLNSFDFFSTIKGQVDFVSICTTNYFHEHHILSAQDAGAIAICEKPVFITRDYSKKIDTAKIYPVMQMRADDTLDQMKGELFTENNRIEIDVSTYRGDWYKKSWKCDSLLSGGLLYNIGVHYIDCATYLLGDLKQIIFSETMTTKCSGEYIADGGTVSYKITTDDKEPRRILKLNNKKYDFSQKFTGLHSDVYRRIAEGTWITYDNIKPTHRTVEKLCTT